jgi:prolipoprotein diacylglyceryl transferase
MVVVTSHAGNSAITAMKPVSADQSALGERPGTIGETSVMDVHWLAAIPSPPSSVLEIGPLKLHAYGLIIALGAIAATWLVGRRLEARKLGTRDDASAVAMWALPAGIIGARVYYVSAFWEQYAGRPLEIVKIWKGGLAIFGGLLVGTIVGLAVAKRRGLPIAESLTVVAPALPLAQAIGRFGNWFNQELFGRATTLPWGLEIDDKHLPDGFASGTLFHPTFLYESLGNLLLFAILLQVDRRARLRPGQLFVVYTAGYATLRFLVEMLRIDPSKVAVGLRLNQWTAVVVFVSSVVLFIVWRPRPARGRAAPGDGVGSAAASPNSPDAPQDLPARPE